jgi:glycosyltransferase involved in cell wall biosynthesis
LTGLLLDVENKDKNMTQNFPLVSIVTPAFNQAEYLSETIESVLAQNYPNIEYIVIDDGSTDTTPDILRRYSGRIRWERHENMGQARTLNKGWEMSRGEYVGYLSSDDLLEPDAVSGLVNILKANPDAVVAYGDFDLIDAASGHIKTVVAANFDHGDLTIDLVCQPGPGAIFKREIIDKAGPWDVQLRQTPDFEFWMRASRYGGFVRLPQVVAKYRIHDGSASFQEMSYERSMEIVKVVSAYWVGKTNSNARRAISNAYLIASKNHAQSKRYFMAVLNFCRALSFRPAAFFSLSSWRMLASGALRRLIFKGKK